MATVIVMLAPSAPSTKAALATALITAVAAAYRVPESRVNVFFQEYEPANRYGGEIAATILIHALPRALELKRELVKRSAAAVVTTLAVPPEHVNIILQETAMTDSGVGGILAIDKRRD